MSTIPLSAREGYMQNISGDDTPPPSIERDDSKLDALLEAAIDNAADTITDRTKIRENDDEPLPALSGDGWVNLVTDPDREAPAPREEGLEKIMRGREEKLAEREIKTKQYQNAKPYFEECERLGVSPDALLHGFKGWDDRFDTEGPEAAAYALAESAFRLAPHSMDTASPRIDPDEQLAKEYPDPLDRAIAKAQRSKDSNTNYASVMEAWNKLQAKYPTERLDDVMRRAVLTLKDLGRDPWGTASRIAAGKGMPVTPPAREAAAAEYQAQAQIAATIEQGASYMPNMRDAGYRREMGEVMSLPDFVNSGNDAHDLERAHRIVEIRRQQPDNVRATIDHYGPAEPDYQAVRPYVEAVLRRKDLQFTLDTNVDANRVWQIARTAMQQHTTKQRQSRSTLDGQIRHAMAQAGM